MATDHPQTWHYGLVARYWAEKRLDAAEAEFLKPYVEAPVSRDTANVTFVARKPP